MWGSDPSSFPGRQGVARLGQGQTPLGGAILRTQARGDRALSQCLVLSDDNNSDLRSEDSMSRKGAESPPPRSASSFCSE